MGIEVVLQLDRSALLDWPFTNWWITTLDPAESSSDRPAVGSKDVVDVGVTPDPAKTELARVAYVLARRGGFEDDRVLGHGTDAHAEVQGLRPDLEGAFVEAVGDEPPGDEVYERHEKDEGGSRYDKGHDATVWSDTDTRGLNAAGSAVGTHCRQRAPDPHIREFSCAAHLRLIPLRDDVSMILGPARPHPRDESLPGFDELIRSGIPGPVAALYEASGSTIESITRIQATWRPGRALTARYRIRGDGGGLAGRNDVVVTIGWLPEGAMQVEGPETAVGLWVVPDDPMLPGLRSALDVPTVGRLLSDLGSDAETIRSRLRSYRPGRRAVIQVNAGTSSVFLKVVPPSEVEVLHERHRHLAGLLPVPDSLGIARDLGIVVMPALPGNDLRTILRKGEVLIPEPSAIAGMVHALPSPRPDWKSASPVDRVPRFVDLLRRLLPDETDRLNDLAESIASTDSGPESPVHGDFHEAQILVDSGRPVGLIDVDTFGWGHPADDAATMLGHLHLLAPGCRTPERVLALARSLNRLWDDVVDPVELRLRAAAVALGLATGPFRVQSARWPEETRSRIAVADQWVKSARRVDERSLIAI